jgi:hypothetical protein
MATQKEPHSDERLASVYEMNEVHHVSTCRRCGGFMVIDFDMELVVSEAGPASRAQRCVQCGEIVDSLILKNRMLCQQRSTNALFQSTRVLTMSNSAQSRRTL